MRAKRLARASVSTGDASLDSRCSRQSAAMDRLVAVVIVYRSHPPLFGGISSFG